MKIEKNYLQYLIDEITEQADETLKEGRETDLNFGKLLGYAESLSIIKSMVAGEESEYGLDYDIDAKYLYDPVDNSYIN